MSKMKKLAMKEKRREAKRVRKEDNRKRYETLIGRAENRKKKIHRVAIGSSGHPTVRCGNIGCKYCSAVEWGVRERMRGLRSGGRAHA